MKLSKALRVKNQLISQITKKRSIIIKYNSYNILNKPKWDVVEQLKELNLLVKKLIELKTKISLANKPILETIHLIEETKSMIALLTELPIKSGIHKDNYNNSQTEYAVFIDEVDKIKTIENLQDTIYTQQDILAQHNAKTEIEFIL